MDWNRRKRLMWRWSLISAGLIAAFWSVWYLVAGEVPVVTSIRLTPNHSWEMPFGISRWWDILIGPIWSLVLIPLFTSEQKEEKEDFFVGLAFGLGVGLVASLVVGLDACLLVSLAVGLGAGLRAGRDIGLGACLGACLAAGLGVGLIVSLAVGLGACLGAGLKHLFSAKRSGQRLAND